MSARIIAPALGLAAAALLLPSCARFPRDGLGREVRPQANDPLTGGGTVALAAVRATAVAAIHQPFTTLRLSAAISWIRTRELFASNRKSTTPCSPLPDPPGSPGFEALLEREGCPPPAPGTLRYLVDGPGFFPEFDRLVSEATSTIDVQIFIFDNDDIGVRCANRLRQRSREIPVRVLFDDLGTTVANSIPPATHGPGGFVPPADMAVCLRSGSEVRVRRTLNPWLVADHTKLLVFDRQTALLGGMNLGREYYSEWHDLMVRIDGPVVATLAAEFDHAWRKAGPLGDLAGLVRPAPPTRPPSPPDAVPLRLLRTDNVAGEHQIMKATLLAIRASRRRVWIETPYFASDEVARELAAAARRGVAVRVVLPSRGDSNLMDFGNLATARGLIEAGAEVFFYPGMTHAKVTLCDGWATLGSANLDTLSLRINRELNVAFSDPGTIRRLEREVFLPDFRRSRPMTLADTDSPLAPLAESIADHL